MMEGMLEVLVSSRMMVLVHLASQEILRISLRASLVGCLLGLQVPEEGGQHHCLCRPESLSWLGGHGFQRPFFSPEKDPLAELRRWRNSSSVFALEKGVVGLRWLVEDVSLYNVEGQTRLLECFGKGTQKQL